MPPKDHSNRYPHTEPVCTGSVHQGGCGHSHDQLGVYVELVVTLLTGHQKHVNFFPEFALYIGWYSIYNSAQDPFQA
jgi:hypothetical protein